MIDVDSIPDQVLTDIAENLGIEDGPYDAIAELSATEALDRFLIWNGIQGYTGIILEAVEGLQVAETIAGLREALKGDIDTNVAWYAIQELMLKHGHRGDSTLTLVSMAMANCLETRQRALALLKIQGVIGS
jgi:hypothetical protein